LSVVVSCDAVFESISLDLITKWLAFRPFPKSDCPLWVPVI
jgi:hypothetical protein